MRISMVSVLRKKELCELTLLNKRLVYFRVLVCSADLEFGDCSERRLKCQNSVGGILVLNVFVMCDFSSWGNLP